MKPLCVEDQPLTGIHLIEASAGTGKTFNITRLYIRLLLERELSVQQILVMTFTRAATAELKGRLAAEIERAYHQWAELDEPFYQALRARQPEAERVRARLRDALLHMDEAAIYTIHGFCRRALTQEAFVSGIGFHAEMEADSRPLVQEALEDWYREVAPTPQFVQLSAYCATPEAFARRWQATILGTETLPQPELPEVDAVWSAFRAAWFEAEREHFERLNVASRRNPRTHALWQAKLDQLDALARGEATPLTKDGVPEPFGRAFRKEAFSTAKKEKALPCLKALAEGVEKRGAAEQAWWAWRGVQYAREHLERSKDRLDQLDFSDLIRRLRHHVESPQTGPELVANLGRQFPAALVDEFQDTDPDQYAILQGVYGRALDEDRLLCMIGDPKQAIYGFRGGDVFAYLSARKDADYAWVMAANYRSAPEVIRGYNRLFYGGPVPDRATGTLPPNRTVFGYGIDYHPVDAARDELQPVVGPAGRAAFQWGLLPVAEGKTGVRKGGKGYTQAGRQHLAQWSAREIRRLLAEDRLDGRALTPADIAVLVRDRHEAAEVQDALHEAGLDAVYLSARESVFESPESDDLLRALHGVLHLEDERALVAALATPLFGFGAEALHALQTSERRWAQVIEEVAALRERWLRHGFMSMALRLVQHWMQPDPERQARALTNTLHLLELLQEASQSRRQPEALLHWFRQARSEAGTQEAELRLESDGHLIRIVTLHGAKGLEYPVVFLPFVSYAKEDRSDKDLLVRYHDPDDGRPRLAFNPAPSIQSRAREERLAEDIRLLYVGATRGERRVYVLAAPFERLAESSLARCLGVEDFEALQAAVEAQAGEGACGVVDLCVDDPGTPPLEGSVEEEQLAPAHFAGRIERDWWLSSFSALTRNVRHGGASARDRDDTDEEAAGAAHGALRFRLARGAEAGNLLHDLLETADFGEADFTKAIQRAELRYPGLLKPGAERVATLGEEAAQRALQSEMQGWLQEILHTPLPSGARLCDLQRSATLRETSFYFPMRAGACGRLGKVLAEHRGGRATALPTPGTLKGMLHGFIDLIYCWEGRFYLVDYKSNDLGAGLRAYTVAALEQNIRDSYYDLQYLLYMLALHRYLATRLSDYDPTRHLGGVHYLYLRGMHPEHDTGVFHCVPDLQALRALDALFEGAEVSV